MLINKIRNFIPRLLHFIPISSEIIGPPKGYTLIHNYMREYSRGIKGSGSYEEIYSSYALNLTEPKSLDNPIHWRFRTKLVKALPEAFVAVIPAGRTWNDCAVIAPNDRLLLEVSKSNAQVIQELPKHHPITIKYQLPKIHCVFGTVAVLSVAGANTYAHWLLDLLPRFNLLLRSNIPISDIDYFIVNGTELPFQEQTLKILDIPQKKLISSSPDLHIKADRLVVPSLPRVRFNTSEWTPKWVCDFLKEKFLHYRNSDISNSQKKLYISRENAKVRRVVNETEVIALLSEFGFKVIYLESMPVSEQARLFFSANIIITPHGAGLANLVFCQPKTKIIEFFSPNYLNLCYWVISNQIGLEYYYIMGKGKPSEEISYKPQRDEDILMDIQALAALLKLVIL